MADEKTDQPSLKADDALEAEAKKLGDYELHPMISRIQHRLGSLNIIRNARNKNQVEIEKVLNES
jgi:hypothetical protein